MLKLKAEVLWLPCMFLKGTFTDDNELGPALCGDDTLNILPLLRHASNTLPHPLLLSLKVVRP